MVGTRFLSATIGRCKTVVVVLGFILLSLYLQRLAYFGPVFCHLFFFQQADSIELPNLLVANLHRRPGLETQTVPSSFPSSLTSLLLQASLPSSLLS